MLLRILGLIALGSSLLLGACTANTESTALGAESGAAKPTSENQPAATPAPADAQGASAQPIALPQPKIVVPPKPAAGAPHGPGFDMPLIELGGYAPPRPMDVLKDAHVFTADHPEVASYIPCYCGCGSMGHKNNADCFVGTRDTEGRVTAWVPHGAACAVCIDIAVESMRMRNSGASVSAIRTQVQNEYRPHFPTSETPTPPPPAAR
jgi:Protein of unknown function with PCYCGC motif